MDKPKKSIADALADLDSEKAKLAQWKLEHAEEIADTAKQWRNTDSRLAALSQDS